MFVRRVSVLAGLCTVLGHTCMLLSKGEGRPAAEGGAAEALAGVHCAQLSGKVRSPVDQGVV